MEIAKAVVEMTSLKLIQSSVRNSVHPSFWKGRRVYELENHASFVTNFTIESIAEAVPWKFLFRQLELRRHFKK